MAACTCVRVCARVWVYACACTWLRKVSATQLAHSTHFGTQERDDILITRLSARIVIMHVQSLRRWCCMSFVFIHAYICIYRCAFTHTHINTHMHIHIHIYTLIQIMSKRQLPSQYIHMMLTHTCDFGTHSCTHTRSHRCLRVYARMSKCKETNTHAYTPVVAFMYT